MQTLLFLWLALSGWLFRIIIFGTFVLPFAAPLLLGTFAKSVAIEVIAYLFSKLNMLQSLQRGCCNRLSLRDQVLFAY
jgi:hypothetical protein